MDEVERDASRDERSAELAQVERDALPVGQDERDAVARRLAEEVLPAEVGERPERGRAGGASLGRRSLDLDRPVDRRRERRRAHRREEVRQQAVGQRRDADRHLGQARLGSAWRRRVRARAGSARTAPCWASIEREMSNDDDRLRVGSSGRRPDLREDRLGGRDPEQQPDGERALRRRSRPTRRAAAQSPSTPQSRRERRSESTMTPTPSSASRPTAKAHGERNVMSGMALVAAAGGTRARAGGRRRRRARRSRRRCRRSARAGGSASSRLYCASTFAGSSSTASRNCVTARRMGGPESEPRRDSSSASAPRRL